MSKKLNINFVNEIKCETRDEFRTSIFSDVYKRAHDLVERIIRKNEKLSYRDDLRDYCNERHIVNVVSFLGERGMGKSSAMLSFAFYLKQYRPNMTAQYDDFDIKSERRAPLNFSVLSKIDVAMMMQGESLFDIILAKMWDEYSDRCEKALTNSEYQYRETIDKFDEVKKAYLRYKAALKNTERINDITRLDELHELSKSLNLRNGFESLVDCYLKCISEHPSEAYLVIPLDDLDMVIENVYDKLEEVRFLLTIPRVIVLLTADVNRMTLELNGHFSRKSLCNINVTEMEKERVRGYVANYLGKVLPRNMRIYMPTFKEIESKNLLLEDISIANEIYRDATIIEKGIEIDKTFLVCIAVSLNIMAYPGQNNFLIRTNTLRNIVNSMSELLGIMEMKDNYEAVRVWLQKELNVGCNEVIHDGYSRLLYTLLGRADQYYNEVIGYFLEDSSGADEGQGYGIVIKNLLAMREKWPLEVIGRNLVQWIYAMAVSKMVREDSDIVERSFVQRDIFSSVIRSISTVTEGLMNIANIFSLRFEYENQEEIMTKPQNILNMRNTFNVLMFYNMEEIFQDIQLMIYYDLSENEDVTMMYNTIVKAKELPYQTSLDNIFYNVIHLDHYWRQYITAIYEALNDAPPSDEELDSLLLTMNETGLNLETYKNWKNHYNIKNVWDILPIQHVSVMMELAERLKRFYGRRRESLFLTGKFLDELIGIIIDVLKETENYYNLTFMNIEKCPDVNEMLYSRKIEELYNMGVFKEVGDKVNSILRYNDKDASIDNH